MLKLKTYCWNHCSKIIFKCVNSTVKPIFNIFFWIKWLWVSWTVHNVSAQYNPRVWTVRVTVHKSKCTVHVSWTVQEAVMKKEERANAKSSVSKPHLNASMNISSFNSKQVYFLTRKIRKINLAGINLLFSKVPIIKY